MILIQLLLLAFSRACAFNIDTQAPIVRSGAHPTDAKYFGYSVAPYANAEGKWILVGAPLDDSDGMERFGALYRCKLAKDSKCEPFTGYPDPIREPLSPGVWRERDLVRNQWLGVSVAANPNGIIVTCAHRYVYVDFATTSEYRDPIGRCFLFNSTFHIRPVLAPCKSRLGGIHRFSFCQSGSDVALANDGKRILLGNPGTFNWAGNVDIVNSSDYENVAFSYASDVGGSSEMGYVAYSVAFGSFKFYESTNEFVVGAPRSMGYTGRVIALRSTSVGRVSLSVAIKGSQVGAYFGHSVVAVDLNRDGYDDLVVGAPYYTGRLREQGQVHTYINTQNNDFTLDRTLTGPLARGAFGYAIASVGDVNLDGFTDIVIGAPFAEDPTVFLYTTSLRGLIASPLQVIPSSGLNLNFSIAGFGAALAGGVDLDGNSYGDIVVGAFRSEKAVVLRSKPVATIVATLELTPKTLVYLAANQFKAELCMKYDGVVRESSLNVEFSIEVDRSRSAVGLNPWATFRGPAKSAKASGTRNVTSNFACTTFSLVVQSQSETLIRPQEVILDVAYALPPERRMPSYGGNPPIRPLSPIARNGVQTNSVFLVSGCRGNQTCIPDLRVASARVVSGSGETVSSVSLGEDTLVNLTVLVENRHETAYAVKVNVTFLKELKLKRISLNQKTISCSNETKGDALITYTCNVGDSLASNRQVRLDFVLLLASVSSTTNKFNFTIEAESANAENGTLHDNVLTTPFIAVIKKADFGLQGSTPSQVSIDPANPFGSGLISPKTIEEIGPSVVHTYIVRNRGPSPIPETVVSIAWPHRTADNRYLLYLTGVNVKGRASCNAEELNLINAANHVQPTQAYSPLNSTVVLRNRRRRRRRGETDITSGCKAGGVYQTDCVTFQCKISQLSANETVDIKVQARLYEQTLLQDNVLNLTLSSVAAFDSGPNLVQVVTGLNTLLKKTIVITNIVSAEKPTIKEERKPWVIPVVVVASVVFLTLLIVLLVWLGFFRRPAKEKLQEEKKQLNAQNEGEG